MGLVMAVCVRLVANWLNSIWGMTPLGLALEILVGIVVFAVLALACCLATKDPRLNRILSNK